MLHSSFLRRTFASILIPALCILSLSKTAVLAQNNVSAAKTGTKPENSRLISLELKNCSISDVVAALGDKYKYNLVADAFLSDVKTSFSIKDVPQEEALPQIAHAFGRDMMIINGIAVWRHNEHSKKVSDDFFDAQRFNFAWKDDGRVAVTRADPKLVSGNAATIAKDDQGQKDAATAVPAKLLSMEASNVAVTKIANEFSKNVGWNVSVDPALEKQRICVSLHAVTPGAALGALTLLFNAAQTVSIGQTQGQQQQDAQKLDMRTVFEKKQDAVTKKLLTILDADQKAALENGNPVSLSLGALPADLQKDLGNYINSMSDLIGAHSSGSPGYTLEPDDFSKYKVVVRPDLNFEVHGFMSNAQPPYHEGMPVVF